MIIIEYTENTPSQPEKPAKRRQSLEDGSNAETPGHPASRRDQEHKNPLARLCAWVADQFLRPLGF